MPGGARGMSKPVEVAGAPRLLGSWRDDGVKSFPYIFALGHFRICGKQCICAVSICAVNSHVWLLRT